jgi:hypothetical protein
VRKAHSSERSTKIRSGLDGERRSSLLPQALSNKVVVMKELEFDLLKKLLSYPYGKLCPRQSFQCGCGSHRA